MNGRICKNPGICWSIFNREREIKFLANMKPFKIWEVYKENFVWLNLWGLWQLYVVWQKKILSQGLLKRIIARGKTDPSYRVFTQVIFILNQICQLFTLAKVTNLSTSWLQNWSPGGATCISALRTFTHSRRYNLFDFIVFLGFSESLSQRGNFGWHFALYISQATSQSLLSSRSQYNSL